MKTAIIVTSFFALAFLTNRIVMQKCVNTLGANISHSLSDNELTEHLANNKMVNRALAVQVAKAWERCSQDRCFSNCAIVMSYKMALSPSVE